MNHRSEPIRVLHVDDEPDFGDLVARFLTREADHFEVDPVTSADEALSRLAADRYDCVVSDYDMPGTDGLEFLEAVRDRDPDLPFILFTGKGSEELASGAISAGVTDYLQKASGTTQYDLLANRITNVVERHEARLEAIEAERRLRTIAEHTNDVLWNFTADWEELLFVNSPYEDLSGRTVAELAEDPSSFLQGIHPDDREHVVEAMVALSNGESVDIEYRANADEDFGRWVWVKGEPILDDDGSVTEVVGFARDVTDRKETVERAEALLEQSTDILTVVDGDGTIVYESSSVEAVLGYRPAELVGTNAFEYIHPDDRESVWETFTEVIEQPEEDADRATYRFRHADGSWVWLETVGRNEMDSVIGGYVLNSRDITERRANERALVASETRFRTLFEQSPDAVLLFDDGGQVVEANRRACTYLGYAHDELVGLPFSAFSSADEATIAERWRDTAQGDTETFEGTHERADGTTFPVRVRITRIDLGGDVKFLAIVRDITDQREREEALQRERDRFTSLFENSLDAIVYTEFVDGEPIVLDVNPAFEETFGYAHEAAIGRPVDDLVVPDDPEKRAEAAAFNRQIAGGERVVTQVRRQTADGVRDFTLQSTPSERGERGWRTYAIYSDITERKTYERALEELHEASDRLLEAQTVEAACAVILEIAASVMDHPHAGVWRWNEDTDRLEPEAISHEAVEAFGPPPSFAPGEGLVGAAYADGGRLVLDDARRDPRALEGGAKDIRGYGLFPIGDHGVIAFGSHEVGAFGQQDTALASTLAAHTRVAFDRIQRERTLLEREELLQRQNDRLDEFASVVSHDLRNPLGVAQGRLALVGEECDSEHLAAVERAHDRMERLIENMLSLARAGTDVGETEPVALRRLVEGCWEQVASGSATLVTETDASIEADPSRVKQLLENLLRNAIEHGGDGVTITVGDLPDGFYVEDGGPGIPEADRERVLEPGYTTSADGTGFGLSIVRDVAAAHGWTLEVTEAAGGGARFEFTGVEPTG